TTMTGIISKNGNITGIKTANGEMNCGALVLCIGHSARDTFENISNNGVILTPKPFSVGVRIEHLQSDIDKALYGKFAGHKALPRGEYNFSHHCGNGRGVYTFCMCPGGEVVGAASESEGVVTNGMSNYKRNGKNANSAIAVSILPEDYGNTVKGAIAFQRAIEHNAFIKGGRSYNAPAQTLGDFMNKKNGSEFTKVMPTYMNGKVENVGFDGVLPDYVLESIREGIADFDHKIKGFMDPLAVLTGPETRTSSPVRIQRNDNFVADKFDNLYPCGEGAGYAGGITSAGVDGINCALKIMSRYSSVNN
ncbi:MAG: hypothetical protein MJ236_07135, partial [Clostridia bacterium]|nr:hypothetical protein [Clostridia bacterium]